MKTVIITDSKYRSAIAVVAALGRAGYNVVVTQTTAESAEPPVFFSKYVTESHMIDGSCKDAEYPEKLISVIKKYDRPVLFCIGADTLNMVSRNREEFSAVCDFLISEPSVLDALNDKERVHQRCIELGLNVPKQYEAEPTEYPVVIKPHCGEKFGLTAADRYKIAVDKADYEKKYAHFQKYDLTPIVQQKVEGDGMGACLLIDREGRLINAVCHRRIREYPITGGPSSCCVSFYDESMIDSAYKLLSSFGFQGMAMVEFKGKYILEVNPRVWGSYPMTVCCSSGYTEDYAAASSGERVEYNPRKYKTNVKMRFMLNDTLSILSHIKNRHIKEGIKGIGDIFTAKEALKMRDDRAPFRRYLTSAIKKK